MWRNTGSMARLGSGVRFTAQAARRMLIALTILGIVTLSVGAGFTLVQRASATAYTVCGALSPSAPCTYTTIQAAISDPSGPTTITVAPGTYNEVINITRTVGLIGPNTSINPVTGARGPEAVIDATGKGPIAVTVSAPKVYLAGFTITGAHGTETKTVTPGSPPVTTYSFTAGEGITGPSGVDGLVIQNNIITHNYNGIFELGGTDITINQNLIRDNSAALYGDDCFHGAPFCNGIFVGAHFTSLTITDNTIDESNVPASFFTHFQRAMSIAPSPQGNLTVDHNTLFNSSTFADVTGHFTYNNVSGDFGVRMIGSVDNFVIAANTFTGLLSNAIVSHKHNNSNLGIFDNTVTQDIGDIQYPAGWVFNGPDNATFDLDTLTGANNVIAGNTITYTGSNAFPGASVVGIRLRSGVSSAVVIAGNTFDGGAVGGPDTAALQLDAGATPPTSTVNGNIMRRFTHGVNDLYTGSSAYTFGQGNCISGNVIGYSSNLSGTNLVNAQHNWWGSPNGPSVGPGTTIGYGNPVTTPQVDASSFLTSAQPACSGPVATNVHSNANPVPINTAFTVLAKLDTATTSNAPIVSAYYTLDGNSPVAMTTTSGTFGTSHLVHVTSGSLSGYSNTGTHNVCVFGIDTYSQVGAATCFNLKVVKASTTTTIASSVNPSAFGQSVTFTITVASGSGIPTGSVTLTDGVNALAGPLTLDGTGAATFTTSALSLGTHPLVAIYTPDKPGKLLFKSSTSATLNQVVNKVNTTTTVAGSPNPSVSGQTVTFALTVHAADSSALTGTVDLKDGATTLGTVTLTNGAGSFSTSALSVGTHNITAAYSGDTTHNTSNSATSVTVAATPAVPAGSSNAYIRIVQSSEAYATSDIAIDGATTFPHVAACTVQPYYPIISGKHTFTVQNPSGGATVITQALTLTAGQYYTLAVVGNSAKSVTPALLVFEDDNSVASNKAKVRVYHLSDTLGTVQVNSGSTVIAASLAYQNATGYTNQSAGSLTYSFQPTSGPALNDPLNVSANQVYSIFLMCNGQVSNAAATGVPVALPQTGYGHPAQWLTPLEVRMLLIMGAILLLAGALGFGSYFVIARRRNAAF